MKAIIFSIIMLYSTSAFSIQGNHNCNIDKPCINSCIAKIIQTDLNADNKMVVTIAIEETGRICQLVYGGKVGIDNYFKESKVIYVNDYSQRINQSYVVGEVLFLTFEKDSIFLSIYYSMFVVVLLVMIVFSLYFIIKNKFY